MGTPFLKPNLSKKKMKLGKKFYINIIEGTNYNLKEIKFENVNIINLHGPISFHVDQSLIISVAILAIL